MEILKKIDWKVLQEYIDKKLIISNKHPDYDIWILNYSKEAQFTKTWDLMTSSCRGLVIDAEGNILARCMKKFKNYEEYDPSEIDMNKSFEIMEKVDGSMIEIFWYKARMIWMIASRGSFISEQALEAKKMIDAKSGVLDILNKNCTYVLEIIYPTNRIVVSYGEMYDLIFLTEIETKTGVETHYDDLFAKYSKYFIIVKKYDIKNITDLIELKKLEEDNKEGFVVKFEDNMRVKIKFSEYIRLHSIVTNVSNLTVWEHLKNNDDFEELLEKVPDEFFLWLNKTIDTLKKEFNETECQALIEFSRIYSITGNNRKNFAIEAMKLKKYTSILFKLYDKKPYDEIIWKIIKPVFSKPFKDGFEDNI